MARIILYAIHIVEKYKLITLLKRELIEILFFFDKVTISHVWILAIEIGNQINLKSISKKYRINV